MKTPAITSIISLLISTAVMTGCDPDHDDNPGPTCTITCLNGGSVTSNCECDCPAGFTGSDCSTPTDSGGAGGNGGNNSTTCGLVGNSEIWVYQGNGPWVNEKEKTLPTGYLMTGVGMTVTSDAVTRVMVKGRKLNADCTLGSQTEYNSGSSTIALEKQYTVPTGYVITGVGMGIHDNNVNRLVVKYRKLLQVSTGGWRLGDELTYDSGGTIVEGMLMISDHSNYDPEKNCFAGFGAVSYDSNVWQLWAPIRRITP